MVSQYSQHADDDDVSTQATQPYFDPRRLGERSTELSDADVQNVMCILHPTSPAAFRAVRMAAVSAPQHVLQRRDNLSAADRELFGTDEQETFILGVDDNQEGLPMDLALRFDSPVKIPVMGFCFGRNPKNCDIILEPDSSKRISNVHFRIFLNHNGVLMIQDMSTNGTLVDGNLLKMKDETGPNMRMLTPGSMINILSPKDDELIKFIVQIPTREGHVDSYTRNFHAYLHQQQILNDEYKETVKDQGKLPRIHEKALGLPPPHTHAAPSHGTIWAPLMTSSYSYGMKWDGGKDYNVTGLLGKGGFATVYRLATAIDGTPYAAKELEKGRLLKEGKLDQKLDNEMRIMKDLEHANIVKYIDYKDVESHLYIIMEYVPHGDLAGYLKLHDVLPEPKAKLMSVQTLDALAYLHHKKVTHRDIKPDNILIASEEPFVVKLSDFGLSKVVSDNQTFLKTFCGTLLYCAPEVFPHYADGESAHYNRKRRRQEPHGKGKQRFHSYSSSVDVWSFAAVLWFALVGKPPFEGVVDTTGRAMFERIMTTHLDSSPLFARGISAQAVDLLLKMLNTDPSLRPTERECLEHPWLSGISNNSAWYENSALDDILEEDEIAQGKLSQLSLRNGGEDDEIEDEVINGFMADFGAIDADLIDPRRSKRTRTRATPFTARALEPSQELIYSAAKIVPPSAVVGREESPTVAIRPSSEQPARLFGEIGRSALQSSGLLGQQTERALEMSDSTHYETESISARDANNHDSPGTLQNSAALKQQLQPEANNLGSSLSLPTEVKSLGGAESMMRDINMDSSPSASSPTDELRTPKDAETSNSSGVSRKGSEEVTPKAATALFRRKIDLPGPRSFLDSKDHSENKRDGIASAESIDKVDHNMTRTHSHEREKGWIQIQSEQSYRPAGNRMRSESEGIDSDVFLKPAPLLGKLSLIRNTSMQVAPQSVIRIDRSTISWGRGLQNTHIYPAENDLSVPRLAFAIMFYGRDLHQMEKEGQDITKCTGLHTIITTGTTRGITVNGVRLMKSTENIEFGKLHTGDEVTVPMEEGGAVTWTVELYCGEGEKHRTSSFKKRLQKAQ